jgi:cytochrome c1
VAAEVGVGGNSAERTSTAVVVLAWLAVGLPLAWGTYKTLLSAAKFFQ